MSVNSSINCTGQPNQPANCSGTVTVTAQPGPNTTVQGQGQVNTGGGWSVGGSVTHKF